MRPRYQKANGVQGFTFGIMEGMVMVLGVLIGLSAASQPKTVLIIGTFLAGFSDALANAVGIHVSQETEARPRREVWKATIYCFLATIGATLIIVIPLAVLPTTLAIPVTWVIGVVSLAALGWYVSRFSRIPKSTLAFEYMSMGIVVSVVCFIVGQATYTIV